LAILPVANAQGITAELAAEFAGLRPNFTVFPPVEAIRNKVEGAGQAKRVLGATHVLRIRLNAGTAEATISDAETGQTVGEWHGAFRDAAGLTDGLRRFINATFRVRGRARVVAARAFSDYAEGIALIRSDPPDPDAAMTLFRRALANDAGSAAIRAGIAEAGMAAGAACADLTGNSADSLAILLISGECAERRGNRARAIADYIQATRVAPGSAEAWMRLAAVYAGANDAGKAVAAWRKAIEMQPDYYPCYLGFGNYYLARGDLIDAEALFRHVTWIAPGLHAGQTDLNRVLRLEGKNQ
jgi:tetratricopeptide (TPR) repeat protein